MNESQITDLYTDYLLCSFSTASSTMMSKMLQNSLSHDQITRFLSKRDFTAKDYWFATKPIIREIENENGFIIVDLHKDFVCAIKNNRTVALSYQDKQQSKFIKISDMNITVGETYKVFLKGLEVPVILTKQVFTNKDHSTGELYLVSSDIELNYLQLTTIYQKRWNVELYHKSLKQNAALEKSPTKTQRTQMNHIFCSILAFIKLEKLRLTEKLNHFAFKSKIYLYALKACFSELTAIKEKHAIQLSIQF
jgi:hypothetical protein